MATHGSEGGAIGAVRPHPPLYDEPTAALRPLGVAELLDGAVRLVRGHLRFAATAALPFAMVRAVLSVVAGRAVSTSTDAELLSLLATAAVTGLLVPLLTGVLAPLFIADVVGHRIDTRSAWRHGRRTLPALLVLAIVVAVAQTAGLALFVVGGIWLWGVWAVAAPALVLEGLTPFAALRRSFALVRGRFWGVWGVRALGAVVTGTLGLFVTLPFQVLASRVTGTNPLRVATDGIAHPGLYLTILAVGTLFASVVVLPISAAIDVLLYADVRMRGEGMDIVLSLPVQQ